MKELNGNPCVCEVCGESTTFNAKAIMQTCYECKDIFEIEMSKLEFDEIYKDIRVLVVKEDTLYDREKGSGSRAKSPQKNR